MSKSKAQVYGELEDLLKEDDLEQILQFLSNFMSATDMEEFLEFIKEEKGI